MTQPLHVIALDAKDAALLRALVRAPRSTVTEAARELKMSAPAIRERLRRLEKTGVIARWSIDLDAKSLGYPVTAFVRIRPMPGKLLQIATLAAKIPQVSECYRIIGEDCFINAGPSRIAREHGWHTRQISRVRPDHDIDRAIDDCRTSYSSH